MKREENQRKFHEALLKMLYPPPSPPPSPSPSDKENEEEEEEEAYQSEEKLMKPLNDLPEEEIENDDPSPSNRHDNDGGDDGKLTRAQRKRLRKRKLKEAAASCRRKIIGPLLPDDIDDHSRGGVEDMSNVVEGVRQNAAGDLGHGSVEGVSNAPEGAEQKSANNVSEEEASCSNKNKLKLKQRRKSKKVVVASEVDSINHHQS